jgi:hypothetical protein
VLPIVSRIDSLITGLTVVWVMEESLMILRSIDKQSKIAS